jgi:hypothetical protein
MVAVAVKQCQQPVATHSGSVAAHQSAAMMLRCSAQCTTCCYTTEEFNSCGTAASQKFKLRGCTEELRSLSLVTAES